MSLGLGGLSTSQKRTIEPPFAANSARNGLSIDSTGKVVLGNDVGAVGNPAQLLNPREIFCSGLPITLRDSVTESTELAAGSIRIQTAIGDNLINSRFVDITSVNVPTGFSCSDGVNTMSLDLDGNGQGELACNGASLLTFDPVTSRVQVNAVLPITSNGAQLEVMGTLTSQRLVDAAQAGAFALLERFTGTLYTNEAGAVTFQLPFTVVGLQYDFVVQQAVNLVVTADVTDTINLGGIVSVLGGTLTSAAAGSCVRLVCIKVNQWVATGFTGAWAVA